MDLVILESFLKQVLCQGRSPENFFKVHPHQSLFLIDVCTAAIFAVRTGEAKNVDKNTRFWGSADNLTFAVGTENAVIPLKDKASFILNALKTIQFAFKWMATKKITLELEKTLSFSIGSLNFIQEIVALYKKQSVVEVKAVVELLRRIWNCMAVIPHYPQGCELKHSCCTLHESIVSMIMDRGAINLMIGPSDVAIDGKGYEAWASMARTYRAPLLRQPLTELQLNLLLDTIKCSIKHLDCIWIFDKLLVSASKNTARLNHIRAALESFPWSDAVKRFLTAPKCSDEVSRRIFEISQFFVRNSILPTDHVDHLFELLWEKKILFPELFSLVLIFPSHSCSFTLKWVKRLIEHNAEEDAMVQYTMANARTVDCISFDNVMPLFSKETHSKKLARLLTILSESEVFKPDLLEYLSRQQWMKSISYSHLLALAPALLILYKAKNAAELSLILFRIIVDGFDAMEVDQHAIVSLTWMIISSEEEPDDKLILLIQRFAHHLSRASELDALLDVPMWLIRESPRILNSCFSIFGIEGSARRVHQYLSRSFDLKVVQLLEENPGRGEFSKERCSAVGYCLARLPRSVFTFDPVDETKWLQGCFYEAALFYNPQIDWSEFKYCTLFPETIKDCFGEDFWEREIELQYYDMVSLMLGFHKLDFDGSSQSRKKRKFNERPHGVKQQTTKGLNVDVELDGGAFKEQVPLEIIKEWPALLHLKTFSSSEFSLRIPSAFLPTPRHHRTLQRLLTGRPLVHPSLRNFDIAIYLEAIWIGVFLGNEKAAEETVTALIYVIKEYNRNSSKLAMEPIRFWVVLKRIFEEYSMIPAMNSGLLDPIYEGLAIEACRLLRDTGFREFHKNLKKIHRRYIIDRLNIM